MTLKWLRLQAIFNIFKIYSDLTWKFGLALKLRPESAIIKMGLSLVMAKAKIDNIGSKNPKLYFSSGLFWDVQDIDIKDHADFVIARILDFGDENDLQKLRRIYPDEKLIEVVEHRKGLSPMTRRYWSVYFNLCQQDENDV